jgi:hypothetical protein
MNLASSDASVLLIGIEFLSLDRLCPEEALKIIAFCLDSAQSFVFFSVLVKLFDFEQVVSPGSHHWYELLATGLGCLSWLYSG